MGHDTVEWVYVGVICGILAWVGVDSWYIEKLVDDVPKDAEVIKVTAQQWFWTFEHQDGTKEVGQLHLKKGQPYKFEITSKDVNHAFNMPDWVIMQDAIPGRINKAWFVPDQVGEFPIQCREYCGLLHYNMRGTLYIEDNK